MKSNTLQKEGKSGHHVKRYMLRHASVRGALGAGRDGRCNVKMGKDNYAHDPTIES